MDEFLLAIGTGKYRPQTHMAALTDLEIEVLRALHANRHTFNTPYLRGHKEPGWCRPKDIGASRHSHHGNTLARLVGKGMVARRQYGDTARKASFMYRISPSGILSLRWHSEALCASRQHSSGGTPSEEKVSAPAGR